MQRRYVWEVGNSVSQPVPQDLKMDKMDNRSLMESHGLLYAGVLVDDKFQNRNLDYSVWLYYITWTPVVTVIVQTKYVW